MPTFLDYINPPTQPTTPGLDQIYHFHQDKSMNYMLHEEQGETQNKFFAASDYLWDTFVPTDVVGTASENKCSACTTFATTARNFLGN
jgi:hypothetical protein